MDYPTCDICGAAVADTHKHRDWHDDVEREIKTTVDDALRGEAVRGDLLNREE
jgi:hypothetical protein